ncbi:MAG: hypothetical protein GY851_09500 [bacterium]|nr:hypothetical protein [bacterium]
MANAIHWSGEVYEGSVSSRCWFCTELDGGWSEKHSADEELQAIVAMEKDLGEVPDWAQRLVGGFINRFGACGHYTFPKPFLEAVDAIGREESLPHLHGCFNVDMVRKREAMDYCFCLDAWLAGAGANDAAEELRMLAYRQADWPSICRDLWDVLGDATEAKRLLVARVLHHVRWFIKFTTWDDEPGHLCHDQYLGRFCHKDGKVAIHCYYDVPSFDFDGASPRIAEFENRLDELEPEWRQIRDDILSWWLCAPKAFRFLERIILSIANLRSPQPGETVPGFLKCTDTYPDQQGTAEYWEPLMESLANWWKGESCDDAVASDIYERLGESTDLKRWLVRLLARKLTAMVDSMAEFASLVGSRPSGSRGTKPVAD